MSRLQKQIEFIVEIDKLKSVIRRSYLVGVDRLENSAEHSWHVTLAAAILAEHSDLKIDPLHVIKMLLIHDIVEIDAGDTYFFDNQGNANKAEREAQAANRLFGLLPEDQANDFRKLWDEFEARQSQEAIFAYSLDRFIPVLHAYHTHGRSWQEHGVTFQTVSTLIEPIRRGSEALSQYVTTLLQEAVSKGYLKKEIT